MRMRAREPKPFGVWFDDKISLDSGRKKFFLSRRCSFFFLKKRPVQKNEEIDGINQILLFFSSQRTFFYPAGRGSSWTLYSLQAWIKRRCANIVILAHRSISYSFRLCIILGVTSHWQPVRIMNSLRFGTLPKSRRKLKSEFCEREGGKSLCRICSSWCWWMYQPPVCLCHGGFMSVCSISGAYVFFICEEKKKKCEKRRVFTEAAAMDWLLMTSNIDLIEHLNLHIRHCWGFLGISYLPETEKWYSVR